MAWFLQLWNTERTHVGYILKHVIIDKIQISMKYFETLLGDNELITNITRAGLMRPTRNIFFPLAQQNRRSRGMENNIGVASLRYESTDWSNDNLWI